MTSWIGQNDILKRKVDFFNIGSNMLLLGKDDFTMKQKVII